jgi:hypothetical protein
MNLAQAKLREQVEELVEKLKSRLGSVDPNFNKIADSLPKAIQEMKEAEGDLRSLKADEALQPEQRALKILQDAEQTYEVQVAMQQGGGGGGGGGQMAEDLADLFELELDKLANQYEMQQRAEMQQGDQQIDQMVEKLKELARRQQQELERQRRALQSGQTASSGGNSSANAQRQLADELEKAARQLQQLTREQQRGDVNDAIKKLQESADAMRRAAANGSRDGGAQANEALNRLREAQQRLERSQGGRGDRDLQQLQKNAEQLAQDQKDIANDVKGLDDQQGLARQAKAQSLAERKDAMDKRVGDLQDQLEKLANQVRRDERDTAKKLDEAAGSIRDKRIREMIRYSRATLGQSSQARAMEDTIASNLDNLSKKIADAGAQMGKQAKNDSLGRAADKARDITRGMESLQQRMRDQAQRGQNGQQNSQNGQQANSQNGQQGQQGQQGGQQGQQGGQQANGGQQNGSPNGGNRNGGNYGGAWNGGYYGGYGNWNPDDVRQYRRDFREWATDAEALRRQLQQAGVDRRQLEDIDNIIKDLTRFDNDRLYADPNGLAQLQAQVTDRLKKFEFTLRRKADTGNDSLALSGSDQVPEGFRQSIEEYYRSLAKKQPQK